MACNQYNANQVQSEGWPEASVIVCNSTQNKEGNAEGQAVFY
jgi:hypothetical protein